MTGATCNEPCDQCGHYDCGYVRCSCDRHPDDDPEAHPAVAELGNGCAA